MASSIEEHAWSPAPDKVTARVLKPLGPEVVSLVTIAMEDKRVLEALRHFVPSPSWVNLYKVMEVVEGDVGNIPRKGWASTSEFDRFTHTAVSEQHAKGKVSPPKQPMSLWEAEELMRRVLVRWIKDKQPAKS